MKHVRLWALVLLAALGAAVVFYRHSFGFIEMAAGALGGSFLWRAFGQPGRRWRLLAFGVPVALALAGLHRVIVSFCYSATFHPAHPGGDPFEYGPAWFVTNLFAGWLTNPRPGEKEPEARLSDD